MLKALACFSLLLLFFINVEAFSKNSQQIGSVQMLQIQQDAQIQNALNTKIQQKLDLQNSEKVTDSSLAIARTFFMKYKKEKLIQEKNRIRNDLVNLEIEIKELKNLIK